jgi:glycosyltransferase involved in cell wall biosynthesis
MTRRPIQERISEEPLLSVCCTTYNHEAYLRQALDGILMQRVDFPCEILVGEDSSSDGSRALLREYEQGHPGVFTVFYRERNLGMVDNGLDLGRRARGKYLAWLETDDFWTDEDKLQRQVDFLEAHPDVYAVAHRVQVINEDGTPASWVYPACMEPEYTLRHVRRDILPCQTAALVRRNEFRDPPFDASLILDSRTLPVDRRIYFAFAANGRIHCLPDVMSAYRFNPLGGTSYSATTNDDDLHYIDYYEEFLEYARKCRFRDEALSSAEFLYFFRVLCARLDRCDGITPAYVKRARARLAHPVRCTIGAYLAFLHRRWWPRVRQRLSLAAERNAGLGALKKLYRRFCRR